MVDASGTMNVCNMYVGRQVGRYWMMVFRVIGGCHATYTTWNEAQNDAKMMMMMVLNLSKTTIHMMRKLQKIEAEQYAVRSNLRLVLGV